MKMNSIKKLVLTLIFTVGSFMTLPAYAWPDVDHMNMCGPAAKMVRSYGGSFQGWAAHDRYLAQRGAAYYFRTMCPETKASKMKRKVVYKKPVAKKVRKFKKVAKRPVKVKIAKRTKRIVKSSYNHKQDCIRVDRMNASNSSAVRVVRQIR
ncbi:MAG: hypothetical protein CR955_00160 [Thiotrichales bacterium]|nr:MAG: hypothetical protein CR955_00160 [Thiotrichales bacterium]